MTINYRQLDSKLIIAALALTLIGIILIYSAQYDSVSGHSMDFYKKQAAWMVMALILFVVVIHLPIKLYDFGAYLFYAFALLLLVMIFFVGRTKMGAARWFVIGPFHLTPSEIAKVALLLTLSRFLAYTKLRPESLQRLLVSIALTAVPMMLILKQPDLGTSLVFAALLLSLWFWSGMPLLYLLFVVSPIISLLAAFHWVTWVIYLAILIAILLITRPSVLFSAGVVVTNLAFGMITPFFWNRLADYQKLRIITFLDPGRDPRGAGYQIIQSKIAIGSGGILGKGFLGGSQSQLKYLPERHTDFVFSVLGEEFGIWGTLLVVFLFGYIFYRGIIIASKCRSKFASYLCWGAVTILFFQFFVNVGMTVGLTPVTGLPLPFLSYGGTSLLLSWTLIGFMVLADYYWTEY